MRGPGTFHFVPAVFIVPLDSTEEVYATPAGYVNVVTKPVRFPDKDFMVKIVTYVVPDKLGETLELGDTDALGLNDGLLDALTEELGLTLALGDTDGLSLALGLADLLTLELGLLEADGLNDAEDEELGLTDADGEELNEGLSEGDTLAEGL